MVDPKDEALSADYMLAAAKAAMRKLRADLARAERLLGQTAVVIAYQGRLVWNGGSDAR